MFLKAIEAAILNLNFMQLALLVGGLFIFALLMRAQLDSDDALDLRHLIVNPDTGRLDRYSFLYMLGSVTLTWAFIYYVWSFKVEPSDFLMYAVLMMFPEIVKQIAGPIIAKRLGVSWPINPPTTGAGQ